MGKVKKVIAGLVAVSLVTGAGVEGLRYIRKVNQPEIMVAKVSEFTTEYFTDDSVSLEGYVTSDISQNVNVDKDLIVDKVYVEQGTEVKKGDPLVSFDMSLVQMELNIAKLKKELQEKQLKTAESRYASVSNGATPKDSDITGETSGSSGSDAAPSDDMDNTIDGDMSTATDMAMNDSGNSFWSTMTVGNANGLELHTAFAGFSILAAAAEDNGFNDSDSSEEFFSDEISSDDSDEIINETLDADDSDDWTGDEFEEFEDDPVDAPEVSASGNAEDNGDFGDEDDMGGESYTSKVYSILTDESVPIRGSGTKKDPYVFFCSVSGGKVMASRGFLNKMAGYTSDGLSKSGKGPYYYQLEFYTNDITPDPSADFETRLQKMIGIYQINGADGYPLYAANEFETTSDDLGIDDPANDSGQDTGTEIDKKSYQKPPFLEGDGDYYPFTLSAAMDNLVELLQGNQDAGLDDPLGGGDLPGDDSEESTVKREEALKYLDARIKSLKLDIRQSEIDVAKLEKKVNKQTIYSKLDGVVTSVGDPVTGTNETGDAFIKVKNKSGYYVLGKVSELLRDELEEDTMLKCTSYDVGDFNATVMEVSNFPVSSNDSMGISSGNPNVSYYTFTASIDEQPENLTDSDWLTITPQSEVKNGNIVLPKAFVRTKNGVSYVFKDDNGILRKTPVKVDAIVDYGYDVMISGGISKNDRIAFPYGKNVQDGAKTIEATADQIYNS
ncbi:MAG: efflux RND transporter periplasmic adaptor subunit [Eubacteriales bacterium]|nr:efflux RND transporter periplasmic adaptor subunit [Eubacteriales bacterium]